MSVRHPLTIAAAVFALSGCNPAPQQQDEQRFPAATRPVAPIVSDSWATPALRDAAGEVSQIVRLLRIRPGMRVADIGAGEGYDSLRLARVVGPRGEIVSVDVTPRYLQKLMNEARREGMSNIRPVLGRPDNPALPPASVDAAIMVHMYHEIAAPYAFLYHLAPALRPGGRVGVEELDRPTASHGTPPGLLRCEFEAVGYRQISRTPLRGGLGYFAVFAPPARGRPPRPEDIKPCATPRS